MNMNINIDDLIAELEKRFPKEFTICVQAVQIRMLQEQSSLAEPAEE